MYKKLLIIVTLIVLALGSPGVLNAQGVENMVWARKLERQIGFLASPICEGRAPGSKGGAIAAGWICEQFRKAGLTPFGEGYGQAFEFGDGKTGHNIMGMVTGCRKFPRNSYVIIGAHYDNLGKIGDAIYPGADSNASGVAALVNLASMFGYMKLIGRVYDSNIILVAFDAKEANMAGSGALCKALTEGTLTDPDTGRPISMKQVKMIVDIDQIGSSLSPLKSGREDFVIMLGNHTMPKADQDMAHFVNQIYHTGLEIAFDYYGSKRFTDMFFRRVTDLRGFVEADVPSVLFTSGITMKTNKTDDTVETLNLDVLARRIIFMFHWIENML